MLSSQFVYYLIRISVSYIITLTLKGLHSPTFCTTKTTLKDFLTEWTSRKLCCVVTITIDLSLALHVTDQFVEFNTKKTVTSPVIENADLCMKCYTLLLCGSDRLLEPCFAVALAVKQ